MRWTRRLGQQKAPTTKGTLRLRSGQAKRHEGRQWQLRAVQQERKGEVKGANELRSQTYAAEVAPQPVIPSFAGGRDLVSMRDLSPAEVESLFHLTNMVKTR